MDKLEAIIGEEHYIYKMIHTLLARNYVYVDDHLTRSEAIQQTVGVLQGDPLSPMLFNIATRDVAETVKTDEVHLYMYADDMALASTSLKACKRHLTNSLNGPTAIA
jgi:hypothetical protein